MAILNIKSLPDDLYERLRVRAQRHGRSVSQEVALILEQALGADLSVLDRLRDAGEVTLPAAAKDGWAEITRGLGYPDGTALTILDGVRAERHG